VSTTQLSKQSHDERATNTFENSVGQSFLHLIRSRPRAAASARPTLNIKRRTEQNHKPNSRFLVPLVAVLGCLLTVWVVLVSEGRGTFKPFLRVTERWGIDLRGIEGGYDVIRKSFGIKTQPIPQRPVADVLVASLALEPGQPLGGQHMRWLPWPEDALHPDYILRSVRPNAIETLAGSIVNGRMHYGEPFRETNLAASHGEYVAGMTTPPRNEPNADPNKLPIVIRGGKKSPIR
jgi:SAF domain